jgi:predicted DNA-binding protein
MANQRKEGKKLIGAYLEKPQRERLKAEAKRRGITVADLVRDSINEYIGQHRSPGSNSSGR